MARRGWRSKQILALLPPPDSEDSEVESDADEEGRILAREYFRNNYADSHTSSPVRSISPDLYNLMQDLSDGEEQEANSRDLISDNHVNQHGNPTPMPSASSSVVAPVLPPCIIPETPSTSSVRSPLTPSTVTTRRRTRQVANIESSPLPPLPAEPVAKKRKLQQLVFTFKKTKYTGGVEVDTNVSFAEQYQMQSPLQYFKKFFSDDLLDFIVDMTNLYSVQQQGKSICVTRKEIEIVLGIEIIMGIVKMPAIEDYWSNDLRFEPIASAMGIKRYRSIKRFLHFCDNTNVDKNDSYYKVSTVMTHIRQGCLKVEEERSFAVDEMIIPYKGKKAGNRKQYNPKKPHKWGFKFLVRAGTSGMVYDFFAYDGANTFQGVPFTEWEQNYLGVGGKTVVRLCKTISNPVLATVYFDNWFTSLELLYYLRNEMGLLSLGTIRKDRLRNCRLTNDKDMKKKGRGAFEVVCDNTKRLAVTKWVDSQCIHIASSFCAQDPVGTIERYDKKDRKRVSVPCPHVIKIYNTHMGGVDIADMLTALYRIRMKTRRWYMSIFAQLMDIALNNSWLLHRRDCAQLGNENKLALKKFRIQAALALIKTNTKSHLQRGSLEPASATITKPFIPRPVDESRLDCFDHFPLYTAQGRCRLCKNGKTMVTCSKCEQRLCFTVKKNCFLLFHKNK